MEYIKEEAIVCDGQCKECQMNCTRMNSFYECGNCNWYDFSRKECEYYNCEKSPSCDASDCGAWSKIRY